MSKKSKLFCFTFAGGTADFYNQLEECLKEEIELVKMEYSGHGKRNKEKLLSNFQDTASDLYEYIKKALDCEEYAIMGYSMGSITAVEVLTRILNDDSVSKPKHVFLAAHEPKTKSEMLSLDEAIVDEYVKQRTIDFGGIPEKLLNNNSFWRMYLPIYKADYLMIARYSFESLKLETNITSTIFYSETDTKYEDMKEWKQFFVGECDFIRYEGTHFFIKDHYKEIANEIRTRME